MTNKIQIVTELKKILPNKNYRGRKVLILGLGLHGGGEAATRWFLKHGATIRVTDKKTAQELASTIRRLPSAKIAWHLGHHRDADFRWADIVVQNPGVPDTLPELAIARRAGATIVNEATLFFEHSQSPIIGITGTRGKSTTTHLVGQILQAAKRPVIITGNVRQTPLLETLDRLTAKQWVVAELSSFQLELLPFAQHSPHIGIMTNLRVDHLNRYGTLSKYAEQKYHLFRYQTPQDFAVLNADDPRVIKAAKLTSAQIIWFGSNIRNKQWSVTVERGAMVEWKNGKKTIILPIKALSFPGPHHVQNCLAAVAAVRAAGIPLPPIQKVLKTFPGIPYRQELIRHWRHHDFINDTAATSPDGTLAAIATYPHAVFIVGGTDKKLQYQDLAKMLTKKNIPIVTLPGSGTDILVKALTRQRFHGIHRSAASMNEAVHQAIEIAKPGQPIILSPGAASFGLFIHEFDRGDQFTRVVKKLR